VTGTRAGGSRVRTVFIGSGAFGVAPLRRLASHPDIELVGVVTAPDRPAGRHHRLAPTGIATAARALHVAVLVPERLRTPDAVQAVLDLRPGLAVLADYGQLVPSALLDLRHGALNLHPSLLPRHRGATPIPAAILAGDVETGVTLMRMDEGLDTGPIVAQRRVPLAGNETAPALEAVLTIVAADLLRGTVGAWLRGEIAARLRALGVPASAHASGAPLPALGDDALLRLLVIVPPVVVAPPVAIAPPVVVAPPVLEAPPVVVAPPVPEPPVPPVPPEMGVSLHNSPAQNPLWQS